MARRERGSSRLTGDDRQEAILRAAESLLASRALDDITIEDLATGAGISRPTFYFYFASKDEVVLELLRRVIAEVELRVEALPREFETDAAETWRSTIGAFVDVFAEHRAVSATAARAFSSNPKIHELWSKSMSSWIAYSSDLIESERSRGAAPAGQDARELATALNLMNERVLSATFSGESGALGQDRVLDVLAGIWMASIYERSAISAR